VTGGTGPASWLSPGGVFENRLLRKNWRETMTKPRGTKMREVQLGFVRNATRAIRYVNVYRTQTTDETREYLNKTLWTINTDEPCDVVLGLYGWGDDPRSLGDIPSVQPVARRVLGHPIFRKLVESVYFPGAWYFADRVRETGSPDDLVILGLGAYEIFCLAEGCFKDCKLPASEELFARFNALYDNGPNPEVSDN
jgi:hypothetical protein